MAEKQRVVWTNANLRFPAGPFHMWSKDVLLQKLYRTTIVYFETSLTLDDVCGNK